MTSALLRLSATLADLERLEREGNRCTFARRLELAEEADALREEARAEGLDAARRRGGGELLGDTNGAAA